MDSDDGRDGWEEVLDPNSPEKQHINKIRLNRGLGDTTIPKEIVSALEQACIVLANQLYEAPTHFLVEIIQNANDNKFDDTEPTLVISYGAGHVQIECNEIGFTPENVDAICSLGKSSKKRPGDLTSYVGEKGIGFKSVFRVADVVWVSSRGYSFKFDSRSQLGMITPILDEFPVSKRPGWTSFYLRLRQNNDGVKMQASIRDDLATFDARMLLFLRKLQTVRIMVDGDQASGGAVEHVYHRSDGEWNGFPVRNLEQDGGATKSYVLQSHLLHDLPAEPRREGRSSSEVALAFPIQDGEPVVAPQQVFAFLPIHDFGFSVILQADFLLTANREGVERSNPWNHALRLGLMEGFKIAAKRFQKTPLAYTWIRYVPESSRSGGFFDRLKRGICENLAKEPVLKAWDESLQRPDEVLYVPEKFRGPDGVPLTLRSENESRYLSRNYDDKDVKYLERLGVKEMDGVDFVHELHAFLDSGFDDFAKKPRAWHSSLAGALNSLLSNTHFDSTLVSSMRLIKLRTGEWVSSKMANGVFFPSDQEASIPGGTGVKVADHETASDPAIRQLYSKFGVTPFSISAMQDRIAEIHARDSQPTSISRADLIAQAHFQFTTRWKKTANSRFWVVTTQDRQLRGDEVYIDDNGDNDDPCVATKVFSRNRESFHFLHPDYSSAHPKDQKAWLQWLEEGLGVMKIPRLVDAASPSKLSQDFRFLIRTLPPQRWLEIVCRHWKDYEKWLGPSEAGSGSSQEMVEGADPESLRNELGSAKVLCKDGNSHTLAATFLPLDGYVSACDGRGPLLPISDPTHFRWQVLKLLGVGVENDAIFYVKCLSDRAGKPIGLSKMKFLLNRIEALCTARREEDVRAEFYRTKPLIFVPLPKPLPAVEQDQQRPVVSRLRSQSPQNADNEADSWDVTSNDDEVVQGNWYHPDHCVWSGPPYFRVTASLSNVYPGNRRLFVDVLKLGKVEFKHFILELRSFLESDPLPYCRKVLAAMGKFIRDHGIHDQHLGRLADLSIWPVRMPDAATPSEFRLMSHGSLGGWFIADLPHYQRIFRDSVPLLHFDYDDIFMMRSTFTILGLKPRFVSAVQRLILESGEGAVESATFTQAFLSKSRFVERVLSTLYEPSDTALRMNKWLNLKVYFAGEIKISHCIQDRHTLIRGESLKHPAAITVDSTTGGLRIYMTYSYIDEDRTLDDLLVPLSSHLGMDPLRDSLQVRMLGTILIVDNPMRITEILDKNGIPRKRGCSDDDDNDWLAEARAGTQSHAWGHLREGDVIRFRVVTPNNFDRSSYMFATCGPNGKTRRNWEWPTAADSGSSNALFGVIAPAGSFKPNVDPWGEDDDDDEHLQYLGELEVARMMEKIPGYKYVPEKNWTSPRRERAGIEAYQPEDGGSPNSGPAFTIPDPEGWFGQAVWQNYRDIAQFLTRRPKRWLLDVKASYGPLSDEFSMDWNQVERARKLTWMRTVGENRPWTGDVLVIIRVSNVGTNPELTFIVDPWQSYHKGKLVFRSDGKIKAQPAHGPTRA